MVDHNTYDPNLKKSQPAVSDLHINTLSDSFRLLPVPPNPKKNQFCQENKPFGHSARFVIKISPTNQLTHIVLKCLTFFDISAMVLPKIHQWFLKLFGATFFKPENMAKIMESTRHKTFTLLKRLLCVAAVLAFILLNYPALSAADQFKGIRVTDGDNIRVENNGKTGIIRLVGIDLPETSKNKNEPGLSFSQKSMKYLASLDLNKSVEIKSYGNDRYGGTRGVVYVDGKNFNLEMVKAGLAEVYRGSSAKVFDNDPYWMAEKDAREADQGMWLLGGDM